MLLELYGDFLYLSVAKVIKRKIKNKEKFDKLDFKAISILLDDYIKRLMENKKNEC